MPTVQETGRNTAESADQRRRGTMKALVFHGPHQRAWEDKPRPAIQQPHDAIVRLTTVTICGTDLHILKGDVRSVTPGRILGHEGIGIVDEVGETVTSVRKGDRVLVSCITADGTCDYCRRGMYSHCRRGGWILGNTIDGTQAEYVRTPFADTSLYPLPENANEDAFVMLSDILPTGFECGVLNGQVRPGDTVAIVGAGPVGLATLLTAQFYAPSDLIMVDPDANRLEVARQWGASRVVQATGEAAVREVMTATDGTGVDVAIEAVGIPDTFEVCQGIVAPGGRIANVGVHGRSVVLHLERLWDRNITITTRLVDTVSTPMLLRLVKSGKLAAERMATHHFVLGDIMKAYDTFSDAARNRALKVILRQS